MRKVFFIACLCVLLAAPSGIINAHDISRYGAFCQLEACPFGPMTAEQAAAEEKAAAQRQAATLQLGGLVAGFMLFCFSGLKGLTALRWRRQGQRVQGKIIGILDLPRFRILKSSSPLKFTPVLAFKTDGKNFEAKLDQSFLKAEDAATGRVMPLLVLPGDPTVARQADTKIFDLLDILMSVSAVILAAAGLSRPPIQPLSLAVAGAIAAFMLWHIARLWMPSKLPATPPKLALGAAYGVRPVEEILKERAVKAR